MTNVLESPWLIEQTRSHLIFGVLARRVDAAILAILIFAIWSLSELLSFEGAIVVLVIKIAKYGLGLVGFYLCSMMPRLRQAILFWLIFKFLLGVVCFLFIFVVFPIGLSKGEWDAWLMLTLGLLWMPGLEFIPAFSPRQKWITVSRLIGSAPLVYLGIISGNWHWS